MANAGQPIRRLYNANRPTFSTRYGTDRDYQGRYDGPPVARWYIKTVADLSKDGKRDLLLDRLLAGAR